MDIWKVKDKKVTFNYSSTNNIKRNRGGKNQTFWFWRCC